MGLFYNAPEPTRGVCSQKTVFLSVSVGSGPKPLIPYKMKFHMTHAGQINAAPHRRLVHYSASDSGAEYCDERVCVCVCLSAIISSELHVRSSPTFSCMLPMAVAPSSSGGVMISYVLPVFG